MLTGIKSVSATSSHSLRSASQNSGDIFELQYVRKTKKGTMSGILTNVFRQSLLAVRQQAAPKANIVYGPSKVKISKAEKFGLGSIMIFMITLPSGYILSNLQYYQKHD